jgi:hypothetical protein
MSAGLCRQPGRSPTTRRGFHRFGVSSLSEHTAFCSARYWWQLKWSAQRCADRRLCCLKPSLRIVRWVTKLNAMKFWLFLMWIHFVYSTSGRQIPIHPFICHNNVLEAVKPNWNVSSPIRSLHIIHVLKCFLVSKKPSVVRRALDLVIGFQKQLYYYSNERWQIFIHRRALVNIRTTWYF